jgi:exopolysaccharide biosynthesis protein
MYSGQRLYQASGREEITRRTVVAQDGQGRILLMATPLLGLSLDSLAQFLLDSDLGIVDALNLDGGGSTMIYVERAGNPLTIPSLDPVPAVVAVYPR